MNYGEHYLLSIGQIQQISNELGGNFNCSRRVFKFDFLFKVWKSEINLVQNMPATTTRSKKTVTIKALIHLAILLAIRSI